MPPYNPGDEAWDVIHHVLPHLAKAMRQQYKNIDFGKILAVPPTIAASSISLKDFLDPDFADGESYFEWKSSGETLTQLFLMIAYQYGVEMGLRLAACAPHAMSNLCHIAEENGTIHKLVRVVTSFEKDCLATQSLSTTEYTSPPPTSANPYPAPISQAHCVPQRND